MKKTKNKRPGLRLGKQKGIRGEIKTLCELHNVLEIADCGSHKAIRILRDPKQVYYFINIDDVVGEITDDLCDGFTNQKEYKDLDKLDKALEDIHEVLYGLIGDSCAIVCQK